MDRELRFRIVVEKPPAGVDFGLQKGRGAAYETVQTQRSGKKDLQFEFTAAVKTGTTPVLLGPMVQGPPSSRFVYLDIGTYAGQTNTPWSRRLKVPLAGITRAMVDRIADDPRSILEARVPGTGRDGGPSCASVKDFGGWKVKRS